MRRRVRRRAPPLPACSPCSRASASAALSGNRARRWRPGAPGTRATLLADGTGAGRRRQQRRALGRAVRSGDRPLDAPARPGASAPTTAPRACGDGRVLVAGGQGQAGNPTRPPATEFYSPDDQCLGRRSGDERQPRYAHTATLLSDGRIFVAGRGHRAPAWPTSPPRREIFDPATGRWTLTAPMAVPRLGHTATLLANGQDPDRGRHDGRQQQQHPLPGLRPGDR